MCRQCGMYDDDDDDDDDDDVDDDDDDDDDEWGMSGRVWVMMRYVWYER